MKKLLAAIFVCASLLTIQVAPAIAETAPQPAMDYTIDASPLPDATASPATFQAGLRIVFTIVGALCLLMITIGGFRYITSQGDSQDIAKAKNTILYALIGLLVSVSAVAIVTFVLART